MKKKFKILIAAASFCVVGATATTVAVLCAPKDTPVDVDADSVPTTTFTGVQMKTHDGSSSTALRLILHSTGKGNNTHQDSQPTWTSSEITFFNETKGVFEEISYGFNGYSGTDFMFRLTNPYNFESGTNRYIVKFPAGMVIDSGVCMAQTQFLQFQIYSNGTGGFCFSSMFGSSSNPHCNAWSYSSNDSNKVEVTITQSNIDFVGRTISNISVADNTIGDSEGFLHLNSSDITYPISGHQRMCYTTNCNYLDLNYWEKLKFSTNGLDWVSAIYVLQPGYDGSSTYFNEGGTYQFGVQKQNGSCHNTFDKYKFIKFEAGIQLPYYEYMVGTDSTYKCYVINQEIIYRHIQNWEWKRLYRDPDFGSTPTLCDYNNDLSSFTGEWTTGTETAKSFYKLSDVNNRTFDVTFDWRVMGSGGGDLFRIKSTYDGAYQDTAIYRNSDGKIRIAEVDTTDGGDKWSNLYAEVGDVVRIRYKRTYDSDMSGFTSSCWVNGYQSELYNTHCSVKSDHLVSNDKMVMWITSIKSPGAIRSAIDDDYSSKSYKITLINDGQTLGSYTVNGGTTMGEVISCSEYQQLVASKLPHYDVKGWKNELGLNLNGNLIAFRDRTIEIVGEKQKQVSFDTNGSSTTYEDIWVSNGQTISNLDNYNPQKDGYMFTGWTCGGNSVTSTTPITTDMTLIANYQEYYAFSGFGYWNGWENGETKDSGKTWRLLSLRFNGVFDGPDASNITVESSFPETGNHIYLNGQSFATLGAQNLAHIRYYGTNDSGDNQKRVITIAIDKDYMTNLIEHSTPHISIDEGTVYYGKNLHALDIVFTNYAWKIYSFSSITTMPNASLKEFDGDYNSIMFETRFGYSDFNVLKTHLNEIQFGTYIVVKNAYDLSGYNTVGEYIENTTAGGKTYVEIPNSGKDFKNIATAEEDGYFSFTGTLANIKEGNLVKDFIPVGYLKFRGHTYYGQNGIYSVNLLDLLLKNRESDVKAAAQLNKYDSILSLNTIDGTYGMSIDYSSGVAALNPVRDAYYALTPSFDVSYLRVGNKFYKMSIPANTTKYILNNDGDTEFADIEKGLQRGFAEPTHEYWPNDTNQATYNTAENNAAVCELVGAKSMRIWLNIESFVSNDAPNSWVSIGMVSAGYSQNASAETINSYWDFDQNKVNNLKATISQYRNAGIEEITFLINSFVRDGDSQIFTLVNNDGSVQRASFWEQNGKTTRGDWSFMNMFPEKYISGTSTLTFEYQKFLIENAKFYERIGDNFDGLVDSVETMNEINLDPLRFDYRFAEDNYVDIVQNNNNVFEDNEFLAEMSMDYCKAMTDGIKRSGAHIRVLSPSISPRGDLENKSLQRDSIPTKNYTKITGVYFKQDGRYYLEECLKYIRENGNSRFNDYFQGLNLHPYLFDRATNAGIDNNSYLYINAPKDKVGFENQVADVDYNSNYAEDWGDDIDRYHDLLEEYGDYNVPFYLTEFGLCDKSRTDSYHWGSWNSTGFIREVIRNLDAEIQQRKWIKTYYWYRIFDFNNASGEVTEPDFGVVDTNGNLKYSGQEFYYLNNGSEYPPEEDPVIDVGGGE